MQKKAFLLSLALVSTLGIALTGCGGTYSVAKSSSAASETSSSEAGSSSEAPVMPNAAAGYDSGSFDVDGVDTGASGAYSYLGQTYAQKTTILSSLEKYAYQNYLTGLPLYENGGKVMYNTRLTKGTTNYITGYGFSNLRDGTINSDMANEKTEGYKRYYHNWEASDPGTINALDSDGSQVSDLYGNIASGYWGTKMNSAKDGYEWYGVLSSKNAPVAINSETGAVIADATSTTLTDTWRIYVRTGESGKVKYRTGSTMDDRKAYDGTYTTLEDYITPYKVLLNQKNAYYRGAELAANTGKQGIVGAAAYYNATAEGDGTAATDEAWKKVGIKSGTDTDGDYVQFQFLAPCTRFYAMYDTSEALYQPIPKSFFTLVGAENYGNYNKLKTTSPIDNILSVGPYYLESWQTDKAITFKKNASWYESLENTSLYRIPGIHTAIISAYESDKSAPFKEFLLGSLDAASIPSDYLEQFKDDPRTTSVPGDATFKLNINSCTEEQWASKFGKEGTIAQTAEADYWDVKPWMSNSDFLDGLMLSIDRATFSDSRGTIPSLDYYGSAYMSNPEEGISYDSTAEHKAVLKSVFGDYVSTYGFNKTAASAKFKSAVDKLVADGKLVLGTVANPTEISIKIEWMYDYQITDDGKEIAKYITDAFNDTAVCGGKVILKVEQHAGAVWSDVYYKQLMVGQFDLGFGSISGNTLDPLNFMEVLKSNNSSGFTLNWGPDTSTIVTGPKALTYDNKTWSFDTLWKATDQGVLMSKGMELPPVVLKYGAEANPFAADGSFTFTITYQYVADAGITGLDLSKAAVTIDDLYVTIVNEAFTIDADYAGDYVTTKVDTANKKVTVTLSADAVSYIYNKKGGVFYFGADYTLTITDGSGAKVPSYSYTEGAVVLTKAA